ncbi:hypothetical protein BaRGS_00016844 [Batillaria attramentaria]|uniref:Uncharacterized protein n=1 Tax=Batillaria attramentaria TaxID=370345 RepID=A0ABD0KXC6_9CAEN
MAQCALTSSLSKRKHQWLLKIPPTEACPTYSSDRVNITLEPEKTDYGCGNCSVMNPALCLCGQHTALCRACAVYRFRGITELSYIILGLGGKH